MILAAMISSAASHWCDRGARITKGHHHFVVQMKSFAIPPNR